MSYNQAVAHGKEKREKYCGSKAFDKTCRNHGSCPYCRSNRLHSFKKRDDEMKQRLRELKKEADE